MKLRFGWAIYPKWHATMIVSNVGKQQANFVYQNINLKMNSCNIVETLKQENMNNNTHQMTNFHLKHFFRN
jgi:hypothetical protein